MPTLTTKFSLDDKVVPIFEETYEGNPRMAPGPTSYVHSIEIRILPDSTHVLYTLSNGYVYKEDHVFATFQQALMACDYLNNRHRPA